MPFVLEPSWLGRRVSVRRVLSRRPDGRPLFGDVVGDLVRLDASVALIETRHGPVEVAVDSVNIAKLAPPSTADELALQAVAAAGWRPAESAHLGGWVLRANGGFSGRANSVLPLRAPGLDLDDAVRQAGAWYAQRGLPLKLLVPTEARRLLDAGLAERGWPVDYDVNLLAGRLDQLRAEPDGDVHIVIAAQPDEAWFGRYHDGAEISAVGRALLTRHDQAGFASLLDGEQVVAVGRGTIDDGWLGITAIEVDPRRLRSGLATTAMAALWNWGRDRGATSSYLQVRADNAPAVALYTKLGYWLHHEYRYRTQPEPR
jgi:ribosomal protein S18 acetylase RimI-like enzyme